MAVDSSLVINTYRYWSGEVSCRVHGGTRQSILNIACHAVSLQYPEIKVHTVTQELFCFKLPASRSYHHLTASNSDIYDISLHLQVELQENTKEWQESTFKPERCGFKSEWWGLKPRYTANFFLGGTAWRGLRGKKASFHPERRDKKWDKNTKSMENRK